MRVFSKRVCLQRIREREGALEEKKLIGIDGDWDKTKGVNLCVCVRERVRERERERERERA